MYDESPFHRLQRLVSNVAQDFIYVVKGSSTTYIDSDRLQMAKWQTGTTNIYI